MIATAHTDVLTVSVLAGLLADARCSIVETNPQTNQVAFDVDFQGQPIRSVARSLPGSDRVRTKLMLGSAMRGVTSDSAQAVLLVNEYNRHALFGRAYFCPDSEAVYFEADLWLTSDSGVAQVRQFIDWFCGALRAFVVTIGALRRVFVERSGFPDGPRILA
jgi:hypothetical protein